MGEQGDDNGKSLEERLAVANAAAAQAEDAISKIDEPTLEDQVADAERRAADLEAIAAAKAEHGAKKIGVVHTDMGALVFKRANTVLFRKFQDLDEMSILEVEKLIRPCRIHPDVAMFDRILDELPGVIPKCGIVVNELAGVRKVTLAKK